MIVHGVEVGDISEECYKAISKVWTWEEYQIATKEDQEFMKNNPGKIRIRFGRVEWPKEEPYEVKWQKYMDEVKRLNPGTFKKKESWFKRLLKRFN